MSGRLLLLSGGLDSTALAAWLRPDHALTIDYGHVSAVGEIAASRAVCARLDLPWSHVRVDCSALGSGLLAGTAPDPHAPVPEWWPYRNQMLVTAAAAWALPRNLTEIIVGSVATDDTHLDGTAAFYEALDGVVSLQEGGLRVRVPALRLTTTDLLRQAQLPAGVIGFTHSCHRAPVPCGLCPGCIKRSAVLDELGLG